MDRPTDMTFKDIGAMLDHDYRQARQVLDMPTMGVWMGHILWDMVYNGIAESSAITTRRKEWRRSLGLPPL